MGAKIFFLKDGLEKLAFATWEKWVRSVRAVRHCSPRTPEVPDVSVGVCAPSTRAGQSPASKSLKGQHCTEHTLAISDAAF